MTSRKEEPNPSILFGDSAGDDPFSQIQQQNAAAVSEAPAKEVIEEKKKATTVNEQSQKTVGDASSLFGGAGNANMGGNADLFFSSASNQQTPNQPLTSNASAATFFEQSNLSQNPSESFFDGLGQPAASSTTAAFSKNQQQQQPAAAASLTQAYDPNTYSSYDYNQQTQQHEQIGTDIYNQQDQQQQYDQSQWIQFDPNIHYYYDEQGQVHYYDPNTNQEYDMSQYGYDQTGQTYDYQYDPQYAEYYAQQGYDTSAYAATPEATGAAAATVPDTQQQAYAQENYDPNAYAPQQHVTAHPPPSSATTTADQGYYNQNEYAPVNTSSSHAQPEEVQPIQQQQTYDYSPQAYAPVNNAVAEVPAQIQSEQTIDTQHYSSQQQEEYGVQNYTPADASTEAVQYDQSQQPQEYSYQGYEATDLQRYAPVVGNNYTSDTSYTPQAYSQTDFFAEDLQKQQQVPPPPKSLAPPPMASAPPKSVVSPPPQQPQTTIPPPPKATAPPQQQAVVPTSAASSRSGSYDASVPVQEETQPAEKEVDLDDLDDLVLGGSVKGDNQKPVDEFDLLMNTADYDAYSKEAAATEPIFTNPNQYETHEEETPIALTAPPTTAAVAPSSEEHKQDETVPQEQTTKDFETFTSSYEPQQPAAETFTSFEIQPAEEQPVESSYTGSYEPQQTQEHVESYGAYDAQQYELQQQQPAETYASYEPQQGEQVVDYSSYVPQQGEQAVDYSSYEPQQADQSVNYTSYEPQQADQSVNYSAYEPQQADQTVNYSSYEPQQAATSYESQQQTTNAYEPRQQDSYYNNYEPPQDAPAAAAAAPPVAAYEPPKQYVASPPVQSRNVVSMPPPQRKNMISPPPAGISAMQSYPPQRSNSITEPDRKQTGSPFTGYYGQFPIERSATVPPPITERIASPRPALIACPDPQCEGENKVKAKFCCECGRPLAGISRSTTPSANLSPGAFTMNESFSPLFPVRTALDDKKDAMMASLKTFHGYSVLVNSDEKQKLALEYIESRIGEFEESKALLWNIVKLMIQHQDSVLGNGGKLDKAIVALLSTQPALEESSSSSLDKLENFLAQGDREGACQFAVENDMWTHALIISQSNNTDQFKRVISQFIDRELFSSSTELIPQVPGDKKSLRMLYSVFSGAGADAVVELARNSPEEHPTSYSKESLEGWKNALALILANRSTNDKESITGLGDQLKQVGSLHDACICYILSPDTFIGLESGIVGAEGTDIYTDLDALYLTELYEFALSTSEKPLNLQNYKFIHAWWLSEFGFTTESQIYCDSIVVSSSDALQGLKQIGQICDTTLSDNVTSLLNKSTFDTLIGSIESKSSQNYQGTSSFESNGYIPAHDYSGQEAASDVNHHNYGYGYGGGYTETADNNGGGYQSTEASSTPFRQGIQSPFQQAKGIRSPFQKSAAIPQKSPFQSNVHPVSSSFGVPATGGVRSPFQHTGGYVQPNTTESSSGGWWGSEEQSNGGEANVDEQQTNGYQPYQPETPASYQPDSYTPAPAANTDTKSSSAWDDDDALGFGNTKKKPATEDTDDKKTNTAREEKPNEISSEDKKEQEKSSGGGGGWGIFSIFGRKDKDQNSEEKKTVKANLGEQSSFYYDEKEKRWVNKLNDSKPAAAATPPPPKAATPQPASPMPPMGSPMAPPVGGLKPFSMPPTRINSTPNVPGSAATSSGPPSAAPPAFNTPPASSRRGAGKKPMRSRYVDVLNTN